MNEISDAVHKGDEKYTDDCGNIHFKYGISADQK